MDRQNSSRFAARGSLWSAVKNFREASGMMADIKHGRYGSDADRMQRTVYWLTGIWIIAIVVCFGILIWADELNK